jgi:hypothetical protein
MFVLCKWYSFRSFQHKQKWTKEKAKAVMLQHHGNRLKILLRSTAPYGSSNTNVSKIDTRGTHSSNNRNREPAPNNDSNNNNNSKQLQNLYESANYEVE